MINELWLLHKSICIYHRAIKESNTSELTGIHIEKQLFAGFITALINFTKHTPGDTIYLQKISYYNVIYEIRHVENIIVVISFNTTYLSEQKLEQLVNTLLNEICQIIQTQENLIQLRLEKSEKSIVVSLNVYQSNFEKLLDKFFQTFVLF